MPPVLPTADAFRVDLLGRFLEGRNDGPLAALGDRVAAIAGQPAHARGDLARIGQGDEPRAAEPDVATASVHHGA